MSRVKELLEPFPQEQVTFRPGSTNVSKLKAPLSDADVARAKALPLAYIDARDVMDRLDEVLGSNGWKDEYEFHGARTICKLSVWLEVGGSGEWVTKSDGAGDTNMEGEKGGISDAFKRAAVKWGVGRYLYKLRFKWAPINKYKRFDDKLNLWKYEIKGSPPPKEVEAPEKMKANWLITKINSLKDGEELIRFNTNQGNTDARDFLDKGFKELSLEVEDAYAKKRDGFGLETPSGL